MLRGLPVLKSTDWSKLRHAYGRATDTPGHLRALLSDDTNGREQAMNHLWGAIIHQGTAWTATAPVALVIAGVLLDKSADRVLEPIHADLLSFLVCVAESIVPPNTSLEELESLANQNIDELLDSEDEDRLYEDDDALDVFFARTNLSCRKAAPVILDVMLQGMSSMNPRIRAQASMGAATLVANEPLQGRAAEIGSRLLALARSATHSDERSAHVLSLGDLKITPESFLEDPSPAVRLCAALAPNLAPNPAATAILLDTLANHAGEIDDWFVECPPQFHLRPRFTVVARLIERVTDFEPLAEAAVAVARITSKHCVDHDWGPLLVKAFPDGKGVVKTAAQRVYLAALIENAELWDPRNGNASSQFRKTGLPYDRGLCAQLVRTT